MLEKRRFIHITEIIEAAAGKPCVMCQHPAALVGLLGAGAPLLAFIAGDLFEGKRTLVLARAFEVLAPADAERLRSLLDRPRDEKSDDEMREALALLEAAGLERAITAISRPPPSDRGCLWFRVPAGTG